LHGIDTLTHAVRVTLGPKGRNVILGRGFRHTQGGGNLDLGAGKTSACGLRAKPHALLERIWIKID
jgi:hypothetical protein